MISRAAMISRTSALLIGAMVALIAGCATTHDKYDWGDYDPALYAYYKSPAKVGELTATLAAAITAADSHNQPVAPGLRAEYGYLLLQQGKTKEAIAAFQTEEKQWPESTVFMDHMIKVASSGRSVSQPKGQ
jgi:hypothetical protein